MYLVMRVTEREGETQAEGEAGSMQGADRGTRSRVCRIMPWAEGSATKMLSHSGCPYLGAFYQITFLTGKFPCLSLFGLLTRTSLFVWIQ